MTATLLTPTGAQKVRIRDLSSNGARVLTQWPIAGSCDALFKRGELFAAASIIWSTQAEAGLVFYRQLSAMELESAFNGDPLASPRDRCGRFAKNQAPIAGQPAAAV